MTTIAPLPTSPALQRVAGHAEVLHAGYFAQRTGFDWVFALVVLCGGLFAFTQYYGAMDVYEKGILLAAIPSSIMLG